jgi:hypothetical protein
LPPPKFIGAQPKSRNVAFVQPPDLDKDQVAKLFRILRQHERRGQRIDLLVTGLQATANNLTHDYDECVAVLETKSIRLRERIAHRFVSAA